MTKAQEKRERAARARALLFGDDDAKHEDARVPVQGHVPAAPALPTGRAKVGRQVQARSERALQVDRPESAPIAPAEPPPAHTLTHLLPRKWEGAPPQEGDLVFWHGGRWWVEPPVPTSFEQSVWIRIGDHRVPKPVIDEATGIRVHRPLHNHRVSFYVHVDELTAVPADFNQRAARLPTVASVSRAERARAGIRDVGDDVATMLRACDSLDKTYACAAEYLGVPVPELKAKYGHLNNGQQRMNLGNRMRAKWRKEHV